MQRLKAFGTIICIFGWLGLSFMHLATISYLHSMNMESMKEIGICLFELFAAAYFAEQLVDYIKRK